jgi:hypothetical protein
MKQHLLIIVWLFAGISCVKNTYNPASPNNNGTGSSGSSGSQTLTDTVVKYKLNGTQYNYITPGALNDKTPFPLQTSGPCGFNTFSTSFTTPGGTLPIGTDRTTIGFSTGSNAFTFTTGTYTEACTSSGIYIVPSINGYSVKGSLNSTNNYFTLIITSVGNNYVQGTFTGKLSNSKAGITSEATITEGSFKVRLIK